MRKSRGYMQHIAMATDLPGEPLPGQSLVELAGDWRVLIERHHGVTEYGCGEIHVKVSFGYVRICGCNLELARMSKEQLVITGRIDGVSLHRGK